MNKEEIKQNFEKAIGLKAQSIKLLGKGASNVNYLIQANNKKFVFRLNANPKDPKKSIKEFNSLKIIEKLEIGPRPLFLGNNFIILEYIPGTPLIGKKIVTSRFLKNLARLVARLHSLPPNPSLPREEYRVTNSEAKELLKHLKKNLKDKVLWKAILESKNQLEKEQSRLNNFKDVREVITHGDICRQNVLKTTKGLALIDFEDLALRDPAHEIAKIFVDFREPFNGTQKQVFYDEYFKLRKDETLKERVKIYERIILFMVFIWSISYCFKIKNKEMHNAFLNKKELKKGFEYVDIMFKRVIKFDILDKKYSKLDVLGLIK